MVNNHDYITLQVNGESRTCLPQTLLPQLLEQLGLNPRLIAVEYNGEILHRQFLGQDFDASRRQKLKL